MVHINIMESKVRLVDATRAAKAICHAIREASTHAIAATIFEEE